MKCNIEAVHALFENQKTPKAKYVKKKCDSCSLLQICLPKTTGVKKDVKRYLRKAVEMD